MVFVSPSPSESPFLQRASSSPLVDIKEKKYKKKKKERKVASAASAKIEKDLAGWLRHGHAQDRHVGQTTAQLDARNIDVATTFETIDDLIIAAEAIIKINAAKLNAWYEDEGGSRKVIWIYMPEICKIRGRLKNDRQPWELFQNPVPPRTFSDIDPDDLSYVIGVFERDRFTDLAKGFVTCYPSLTKPN